MNGLIGIQGSFNQDLPQIMLDKIKHRGREQKIILLNDNIRIGIVSNTKASISGDSESSFEYSLSPQKNSTSITVKDNKISLKRDKYGVEPLYYIILPNNQLAFATDVKSLAGFKLKINELEPGYFLEDMSLHQYFNLRKEEPINIEPTELGVLLKEVLGKAISKKITNNKIGAWLSGGLDSSIISTLVKPHIKDFHTFSVGFANSPDLQYAKIVSNYIDSIHHEKIVSFDEALKALPDVIYHLESFDALLVRSSIMNYLLGQLSSEYVDEVFSGEGGDELFAGYQYLKNLSTDKLDDELIEITQRLHNTALQRVDRCSSAFGVTAFTPFMDEEVVELALKIPVKYKIFEGTEKWILRSALLDQLPYNVLMRGKSKFWEGSGMGDHLFNYAENLISDSDFRKNKKIKCGWELRSKEEMLYYTIFTSHFGEMDDLKWMGRSKI